MTQSIINQLQNRGFRITKARRGTIVILENNSPLTASEIQNKLSQGGIRVNRTTVYRELDFLQSQNIAKQVVFVDGSLRFELIPSYCHHHVECSSCGKVEDVTIEERSLIESIEKQSKFTISKHSIEFLGLCNNCQLNI